MREFPVSSDYHMAIATMNRLKEVLFLACLLYFSLKTVKGECENGNAAFILGTNIILNATFFSTSSDSTLQECVQNCQRYRSCKSLAFQRNDTSTICYLYNVVSNGVNLREIAQSSEMGSYYMEKICLHGLCEKRLFSLEMIVGGELNMTPNDQIQFQNSTRNQCLEKCVLETRFPCRSTTFDTQSEICTLHRYDRYSRSTRFKLGMDKNKLYFDNNCALQPVFKGTTAEVILLGNAQHPFILAEYDGKSMGECGQLCLKSVQFPCRSFLYGKKGTSSYCALSHQNRIGLLRNENSFSITESMNYYEIAQKLDVCDVADVHFELISGVYLHDSPYKVTNDLPQEQCLDACKNDSLCHAVSINHRSLACTYHQLQSRSRTNDSLKPNATSNFFEKICLQSSQSCSQLWAFERVRGRKLILPSSRQVTNAAYTKEQCLASCLEQTDFQCQSVEYDQRLSECHLNTLNRFSNNEKLYKIQSTTNTDNYYYENNCIKEPRGFCNTRIHKKLRFVNPDKIAHVDNLHSCKAECLNVSSFNCHSYSYNSESKECYLSHHSIATVSYNSIHTEANIETYEFTTCYDVSVTCEPHMMNVNIRTNAAFNGKVYVRHKLESCHVDVIQSTNFSFPISLSGPECGTENEGEGKFSNVIVIQNNDLVLTSMDKAIGVHCTYELGNKTEYAILTIKNISSLERTRGRASPPQLTMKILDLDGNDKTTVKLGEPLRVQVSVPEESAYGIFVRNMVATDATGGNNLTLIDSKGCPAEAKMIREMRRIDGQSRALESIMEAFTFTGSNVLRIETDVETCLDACDPVMCHVPSGRSDDKFLSVESLGRKKRQTSNDGHVFKLTKTVAIHSDKFGVGHVRKIVSKAAADKRSSSTVPSLFDDKVEYEYIEEMTPKPTNSIPICLDYFTLTIGGCAFVFFQVILVTICCAAKHHKINKKCKEKEHQKLQRYSRENSIQSQMNDGFNRVCNCASSKTTEP